MYLTLRAVLLFYIACLLYIVSYFEHHITIFTYIEYYFKRCVNYYFLFYDMCKYLVCLSTNKLTRYVCSTIRYIQLYDKVSKALKSCIVKQRSGSYCRQICGHFWRRYNCYCHSIEWHILCQSEKGWTGKSLILWKWFSNEAKWKDVISTRIILYLKLFRTWNTSFSFVGWNWIIEFE